VGEQVCESEWTNKSLQAGFRKLPGLNEDHEIYSANLFLTPTSVHSRELTQGDAFGIVTFVACLSADRAQK
tara:strand:+ start:2108 stop:2320 length:213 start_codon:yes stop_codon:yes gene_type:complete